ncbi:MAG: CPBP family intramembrane glutamic endopeptidase [Bacillota bacterium]
MGRGAQESEGWRGFAIPRLQTRYNALLTSLIIGALHSIWHIPLLFVKGVIQHTLAQEVGFIPAFLGYAVFVIALAVQLTWVFNNTKGSVLLAAVFHGALNTWNGYIDIYRGHMGGIYAYTALTAVVSIVVVIIFGVENLSRVKRSAANQRLHPTA